MISTLSSALLILRQDLYARNNSTEPSDGIGEIVNRSKNTNVDPLKSFSIHTNFKGVNSLEATTRTGQEKVPPELTPEQVAGAVDSFGNPVKSFSGTAHLKELKNALGITTPVTAKFQAILVEATALAETTSDKWERALRDATHRTSKLVGRVMEINAMYHKLDYFQPQTQNADPDAVKYVNEFIYEENYKASRTSQGLHKVMVRAENLGLQDSINESETGELTISAYQIKTDDGKLVAEMKENGHYVTYNENGTVRREMNRSEIASELSSQTSLFSRLASILYSDHEDMHFY